MNAYIDNIILENVYIDVSDFDGKGWSRAGGITDYTNNSLITNYKVTGTIIAQLYVAGLAASIDFSTLKNNNFIGELIQKNGDFKQLPSAGGIAGYLYCCGKGDLYKGCEITGNTIAAKITSESIEGKIAGKIHGELIHDNIIYCELNAPNEYETGKGIRAYD